MQVRIEEVSPVEKKLDVEVEWPLVAAKLDAAYKELGRDVALKGFRKGKVPRNILERMFNHQVEQRVMQDLIRESFVRAAQQHELQPVAEPIVDEVSLTKNTPFKYSARVEVRAPLEPTGYDGIALEKAAVQVSVEEIDRGLERKREELSEYKPIEGRDALAATDIVICEVRGEVADKPYHRETLIVDLAQPERDPIPGLGKALLGHPIAPGTEVSAELDLPPDADGGGAGKKALLKVIVKETREKSTPALDDDFAKDTGEADTLDELRAKVRDQLAADKDKDVTRELRSQLVKELLKRNEFQVASSLVDRQSDALLHRTKMSMAMQGIDVRNAPIDEEKIKDQLRPAATDEVRAMFLIDAIANKEKVEVTEADLEKRLAEMARSRDSSVARLRAELQKEGRYEVLRHQLREEKTLDLLLSRASITPKTDPSPSEK